VSYPALPLGPDERKGIEDKVKALAEIGIAPSRVWVLEQIEQIDRAQALALIQRWREDEDELAATAPAPAPVSVPDEIAPDGAEDEA
jgi:hypothetical protein